VPAEVPPPQAVEVHGGDHRPQQAAEAARHQLQLVVPGVGQDVLVEVTQQVDQAFLLRARHRVVGGVEVTHQHPAEVLEHLVQEVALPRRPVQEDDLLQVREDPDVGLAHTPDVDLRLVRMHERPAHDSLQELLVTRLVVAGQQPLADGYVGGADRQVEALPERVRDAREAGPVGHILVHGPALQRVAELFRPQVVRREEPLPAPGTIVPSGPVAGHPPADAAAGDAEVEGQPGQGPVLPPDQFHTPAARAAVAKDFDLPVDRAIPLPALGPPAGGVPLEELPGAGTDLVPVVVEGGTVVEVAEVGDAVDRLVPAVHPPPGRFTDPRHLVAVVTYGPACRGQVGADGMQELRHHSQGGTILQVVRPERLLEGRRAGLLPPPPPDDALGARGVWGRPAEAQVAGEVL
jgi:hypothetical protein